MSITEKKRFQQIRRNWSSRLRALRTDGRNRRKYGSHAPRFAECLWVRTHDLVFSVKIGSSKDSATVINDWPNEKVVAIRDIPTIEACVAHWQRGQSWQATGIYNQMIQKIREKGKVDRLRSIADIEKRYESLDALYCSAASSGKLNPRSEFIGGNFREEGGILVHLGPNGTPYFGFKGHHRLAIARALELEYIPAQLGVVHASAIEHIEVFRCQH